MAYSLHIERPGSNIPLEEWLAAASTIDVLRLRTTGYIVVNPNTGERIEIDQSTGDLEMLDKAKEWEPVFFFSQGRATFQPPSNIDSAADPVRLVAAMLAKALNACIVGDDGEEYAW
jgi:hypothetical protein